MFNEMGITLDTRCPGRTYKAGQGVGLSHEQPSKRNVFIHRAESVTNR